MTPPDPAILRLLDANANRVREALRVLEDLARFVLDRADLVQLLKALRHDLRAALTNGLTKALAPGLPGADALHGLMLAARDTPNDVGTSISTPAEGHRTGPADLAAAAGKRLTEALRSIEEAAKTFSPSLAAAAEQLRYRAYDAERRLALALPARCPQWRLCVLITRELCTHHPWPVVARLAIEGGADCLQLREKSLPDRELLHAATALVELARPLGCAVIINDRPDIARLARADGVHVGQTDLTPEHCRAILGAHAIVGLSADSPAAALDARRAGASYLGLGPMFVSTTKPKPTLAGPDLLHRVLADPELAALPHLAISGITPDNAPSLVAAGARGLAVSSAVCSAPDPAHAARQLRAAFDRA